MGNRALSVLATAAILATSSNGWGQDAQGASDVAFGDDGGGSTEEQDAAPPPVDLEAGGEDAGGGSSANDGAPASADNPFGPVNPFGPGNPFDASSPFGSGDPFDSGYYPFDSSDPFGFAELDANPFEPPGAPGGGGDPGNGGGGATATGPTASPVTDTAATDDASPTASDDSSGNSGAEVLAWGDAAPPAREIESPSDVAAPVIGCGGCSTSDSGAQGALAVVFAALVVAWRSRRSHRAPGTKGG